MPVRQTQWSGNSRMAQALWIAMFDPRASANSVARNYNIPDRTLRRYANIALSRDSAYESTGVIWDWDPDTFRLPKWPPPDGKHEPIRPTTYALAHAGQIAPPHGRRVRGFTRRANWDALSLSTIHYTPEAKKRKHDSIDAAPIVPELSKQPLAGKVRFTIGPSPANLYLNDRATFPDVRPSMLFDPSVVDWAIPPISPDGPEDPVLAALVATMHVADLSRLAAPES